MRRFSISRNNCRGEIRLKHHPLKLSHREIGIILPYDLLADIKGREGKIEREIETFSVAGLPGLKTSATKNSVKTAFLLMILKKMLEILVYIINLTNFATINLIRAPATGSSYFSSLRFIT